MISPTRRLLSSSSFALGTLWALAGAFRYIFGIRITLWGFPPFGLEHIAVGPALITGLSLVFVGALLGRDTDRQTGLAAVGDSAPHALPLAEPDLVVPDLPPAVRQSNER